MYVHVYVCVCVCVCVCVGLRANPLLRIFFSEGACAARLRHQCRAYIHITESIEYLDLFAIHSSVYRSLCETIVWVWIRLHSLCFVFGCVALRHGDPAGIYAAPLC